MAKAQVDVQWKVSFSCSYHCYMKYYCICIITSITLSVSVQDGWAALHVASWNGHCEVVRILLEAKADINIKINVSHDSILCVCIYTCIYSHLSVNE